MHVVDTFFQSQLFFKKDKWEYSTEEEWERMKENTEDQHPSRKTNHCPLVFNDRCDEMPQALSILEYELFLSPPMGQEHL